MQLIQRLESADMASRLEFCRWINADPDRALFVTFCSPTRPILPAMDSTIQETPIYEIMIIHMELSKATTNIAFPGLVSLLIGSLHRTFSLNV